MPKWVRAYWDEEETTYLWEVGDDGWVTRSIELRGPELRPQTAAALDEVMRARDNNDVQAVQAYERRYGVLVEKPIDDWDFPHAQMGEAEFQRLWVEARRALEAT